MNFRRTHAIAKKEFLHIVRDYQSLIAALGMPLLLLTLFGYALDMDVDRIPTAIYDEAKTPESQDLIHKFRASSYFTVVEAPDYASIEKQILKDDILMGVVIPRDYSRNTLRAQPSEIQLLLDGTDSNTASIALGYAESVVKESAPMRVAVEPRVRMWYNGDQKSRHYIVPGLIAVILMIVASLLTSLTIAKEWENGTMEQLLSTPVRPVEMLLGKLAAYFVLGVADMLIALALGVFVMHTPFRGSVLLLFFAGFLFLFGSLCWGLLLSAVTRSQHASYLLATVTSFLPAFLLSGFMYSIESMPPVIQLATYAIPARYFITILKGIFLKGVGLDALWVEFLFLATYAAVIFMVATRKMRQKVV